MDAAGILVIAISALVVVRRLSSIRASWTRSRLLGNALAVLGMVGLLVGYVVLGPVLLIASLAVVLHRATPY